MLRSANVLSPTLKFFGMQVSNDLKINSVCVQCVRWKRKPRWMGTAKSKLFRIPERPKVNEEEDNELKRLHDRYKTYIKSLRNYFKEELQKTSTSSAAALQETKDEEEEHLRCMKENEEWNKQVVLLREQRLIKEKKARGESILVEKVAFEQCQKEELERVEQMVREEKERSKFYITTENIDKAIEDALTSTVDYNYSIDLEGNVYRGRKTKPSDVPDDKLEKVQVEAQIS